MMLLYICVITLLGFGQCIDNKNLNISRYEDLCYLERGDCVLEKDCPSDRLTPDKGLCPDQQKYGAECCYSLCLQRGGECIPKDHKCPEELRVTGPGVCSDHEICCVLV